ncbi:MAG TPA: tetratricopeptide repeat protein [Bryobacteraceae bacterium]|jgi:tetratricopeptide (TPR) repeat protein
MIKFIQPMIFVAAASMALAQQPAPPPQSQVKATKGVSKDEANGFNAIIKAQTPDEKIKAADEFVTKFADSQYKGIALYDAAEAADQKGDFQKAIIYGDESLQADPTNFDAKLLVAGEIAQHTRENDLDKADKLAKAEKYTKEALDAIPSATKPQPQIKDEQWEAYKKYATARAHVDLGLIAMAQKKTETEATEFKTAVDMMDPPDQVAMARLANAYNELGKPDDALAVLNKLLAMSDLNPAVKNFAQNEKARAEKAKAGK